MKVFIEREDKETEIEFKGSIAEILKKLNVNSEEIIIVKNGEVVTEEEQATNEDKIEFLSVVSGG